MFHNTEDQILKQEILRKRATGRKSIIKTYGLKTRLFILTTSHLSYYDGNEERRGKLKNCQELSAIKAVERVDDGVFENPFCFQVQFDEYTLFVFASNEQQRMDWVQALRDEIGTKNSCLLQRFHSGVYLNNCWSCCDEKVKNVPGCKKTYFFKDSGLSSPTASHNGVAEDRNENFKVTAKYDYTPTEKQDLSIQKECEYTVTDSSEKNWWFARDELGREGYIPSNYVVRHFGIECEKWYHGDMSRAEADLALREGHTDGTFLVRNATQQGMFTLALCFQGIVKQYHIKQSPEGKYYISNRHHFDTVAKLIEYHKLNCAGLVTRLRLPYTGLEPAPVTLGYGVFQINRNELFIKKQIGNGQFGSVHEAVWRQKQRVAVKMMKPGSMSEHDFIEEAKIMQRFQHKHLVSIYGVCSRQSPLYIVVELMPHGSLLDYLRKNKQLLHKTPILTDMVYQVASAMKYLESEKFIHRDLAARNCLVGENNLIKVGDFGLARYVLDDQYTASEGTKFPVKWAAPEVIDFTKFSSKSDVWAFGILCWEIFTAGKSPYATFSNPAVADEVRRGYRLEQPPHCPNDVHQIMQKCWEQVPENRPSFRDIHESIQVLTEDYSDA